MEGIEMILSRRSIRVYQDREIEEEKLKNILLAGMAAPSAHNSQPWEFIVVRDRETLKALSNIGRYWGMLKDAAASIITVGNLKFYKASHESFFIQDCAAATQNMLLAANIQGIGGVWLGLYPKEQEMGAVRELLQIPREIPPFSVISLGYPAEERRPHGAFRDDKVFYEKYV